MDGDNTFVKLNKTISSNKEDYEYFDKLPKKLQDYLNYECIINMSSKHIWELHDYGVPSEMLIMLIDQQIKEKECIK